VLSTSGVVTGSGVAATSGVLETSGEVSGSGALSVVSLIGSVTLPFCRSYAQRIGDGAARVVIVIGQAHKTGR
jgi:hypothetical protein